MKLVDKKIKLDELKKMSLKMFGGLVKTVVDVEKEIMVVDGEMHADEEKYLLSLGSLQENLWGINLYPDFFGKEEFIEFDSMINIRPRQNNFSRDIENKKIKEKIIKIVHNLVEK
ncbi:MAG: hypothetical protein KatS3mg092_0111 [Patescibacteria group bacterium]|nr:MAG: hypothetical protein KatS3mg092_0111 [Patescibacteria group bacterium]